MLSIASSFMQTLHALQDLYGYPGDLDGDGKTVEIVQRALADGIVSEDEYDYIMNFIN